MTKDFRDDKFYARWRSMNEVSILLFTKRLCERIFRLIGIVDFTGSMVNSWRACFVVAIASSLVGWWTMSFAIMES